MLLSIIFVTSLSCVVLSVVKMMQIRVVGFVGEGGCTCCVKVRVRILCGVIHCVDLYILDFI